MTNSKRFLPILITVTTLAAAGVAWLELAHRTRTVDVSVEGMSCEGCAAAIEDKLANLRGVSDVEVSVEKGQASMTINGWSGTSDSDIADAIADAGYKVAN